MVHSHGLVVPATSIPGFYRRHIFSLHRVSFSAKLPQITKLPQMQRFIVIFESVEEAVDDGTPRASHTVESLGGFQLYKSL